jgi:hypothetical protein
MKIFLLNIVCCEYKKEQDKSKISVILINDMNKDNTQTVRDFWEVKNKGLSRMNQICVAISSVIIVLITIKLQRPNDIKLLKKTLTVRGIHKTLDPAKRKDSIEGRLDDKSNLVLNEVVLSTNSIYYREYKIVDSVEDGFFPNDEDGLVDKVSKRNPFRRKSRWTRPRLSRTPWKTMPFEAELYEVATERYIKAAAIINSAEGKVLGMKIGK